MASVKRCVAGVGAFVVGFSVSVAWAGDIPSYSPHTYDLTRQALGIYTAIAARGGWPNLPKTAAGLALGKSGPEVQQLNYRLAVTGDILADRAYSDRFDAMTEAALKRFQARHGLSETGSVGNLTLRALNVPVEQRLNQLSASMQRLEGNGFVFTDRYVVVNIPGASVEAVANGRVEQRHLAVVGRPDRASPVLESRISTVNINPTWTVPLSIVKADIMPKVAKDPNFLAEHNMRVLDGSGAELDPASIDWSGASGINFTIRQDPGPTNSLGVIRIDMPNVHSVYLHDTPKKELFRSDVRFHSSGCARVEGVRDLAAWLLQGTDWTRAAIDTQVEVGERKDVRLTRPVPVAWVYLTGWGTDGSVQFRDDVYGLDTPDGITASTLIAVNKVKAIGASMASRPSAQTDDVKVAWKLDEN